MTFIFKNIILKNDKIFLMRKINFKKRKIRESLSLTHTLSPLSLFLSLSLSIALPLFRDLSLSLSIALLSCLLLSPLLFSSAQERGKCLRRGPSLPFALLHTCVRVHFSEEGEICPLLPSPSSSLSCATFSHEREACACSLSHTSSPRSFLHLCFLNLKTSKKSLDFNLITFFPVDLTETHHCSNSKITFENLSIIFWYINLRIQRLYFSHINDEY